MKAKIGSTVEFVHANTNWRGRVFNIDQHWLQVIVDGCGQVFHISKDHSRVWVVKSDSDRAEQLQKENDTLRKVLQDIWDVDEMGYIIDGKTCECVQCGKIKQNEDEEPLDHAEECVQRWIERALNQSLIAKEDAR